MQKGLHQQEPSAGAFPAAPRGRRVQGKAGACSGRSRPRGRAPGARQARRGGTAGRAAAAAANQGAGAEPEGGRGRKRSPAATARTANGRARC